MTTTEILDRFAREHQLYHGVSDARCRQQMTALRAFEEFAGVGIEHTTAEDLQGYLASLIAEGKAPGTVRKVRGMIRPFMEWAWSRKIIDAERLLELKSVGLPRGAGGELQPRPYSRTQVASLWADLAEQLPFASAYYLRRWGSGNSRWIRVQSHAMRLQTEAIIGLCLYGGIRRDECFRMTVTDMHHENAYVVVRGARKNARGEEVPREVPWMSEHMRVAVHRWLDFRELMGVDHDGAWLSLYQQYRERPMFSETFYELMHGLGRGWEFHRLRHTAATEMLRAGVSIEKVKTILGHSRIQQTMAYVQIAGEDLIAAANGASQRYSEAISPPWA